MLNFFNINSINKCCNVILASVRVPFSMQDYFRELCLFYLSMYLISLFFVLDQILLTFPQLDSKKLEFLELEITRLASKYVPANGTLRTCQDRHCVPHSKPILVRSSSSPLIHIQLKKTIGTLACIAPSLLFFTFKRDRRRRSQTKTLRELKQV
ncbi:hypothetical protein K438DRAFT_1832160 [Mycena galopus ATCC 62051]|nr:hypothetical protein K438DRAFT_1832160 [Mycena galopus ATCC 62051]